MTKQISYEQAMAELQEIVEAIENGQTNMDQLEDQVKRASELLLFCKNRLKGTTLTLQQLFES